MLDKEKNWQCINLLYFLWYFSFYLSICQYFHFLLNKFPFPVSDVSVASAVGLLPCVDCTMTPDLHSSMHSYSCPGLTVSKEYCSTFWFWSWPYGLLWLKACGWKWLFQSETRKLGFKRYKNLFSLVSAIVLRTCLTACWSWMTEILEEQSHPR